MAPLLLLALAQADQLPHLITQNADLRLGSRSAPSDDETGASGAIEIKGNDITVDLASTVLEGTDADTPPDRRRGTGILVEGDNITIKNARIKGYKLAIVAKNCHRLRLLDCDLSDNWKQHLGSTPEREDESDWMSYHQNEKGEWMRYGAGISLNNCSGFEVKGCTVLRGQCGLMMTGCESGLVWNSSFSFLSGVGIGLYRTSRCRIMHNEVDWCVRGYSEGVYNRGQDSAGILVYEQSSSNVFAYNSVTHGGDGFFLWAGQSTMDTGQGGCQDNVVASCDFSHAPTNGIEATFSRNRFSNNLVLECWHGVWGGYSYESSFDHNVFGLNAQAIAIEHGQKNKIAANRFYRDLEGIALWERPSQDPTWGYAKNRDTASRDCLISNNQFSNIGKSVLKLDGIQNLQFQGNSVIRSGHLLNEKARLSGSEFKLNTIEVPSPSALGPVPAGFDKENKVTASQAPLPQLMQESGLLLPYPDPSPAQYLKRFQTDWNPLHMPEDLHLKPLVGGLDPFLAKTALRGRRYILMGEWGPYDFRSPRLVLRRQKGDECLFEVLGPAGRFEVQSTQGFQAGTTSGAVPGMFALSLKPGAAIQSVDLIYRGAQTIDAWGRPTPAGVPVRFGFSRIEVQEDWAVEYHPFDLATENPVVSEAAFRKALARPPKATTHPKSLAFAGSNEPAPGVGSQNYGVMATGIVSLPKGKYFAESISDDGIRVWVDGIKVIDHWDHHAPMTDRSAKAFGAGRHQVKVEYFQLDGYASLQLRWVPSSEH